MEDGPQLSASADEGPAARIESIATADAPTGTFEGIPVRYLVIPD
jgi:hypothetical protein